MRALRKKFWSTDYPESDLDLVLNLMAALEMLIKWPDCTYSLVQATVQHRGPTLPGDPLVSFVDCYQYNADISILARVFFPLS